MDLNLYQSIDRYGFIQKEPPKLIVDQKESKRIKKWIKMLEEWRVLNNPPPKLEKRIRKGIPDELRGEVWRRLLGVPKLLIEQEGKYDEMLKYGLKYSKDIRQIELDVNRTYRNHIMFRDKDSSKQCMLSHILIAYSVYNSEIGYCQGMSQIAALLLMYMNEEDSFWALSTLMSSDRHAMHGFFIPGFPKLRRFSEHHDHIIRKLLPKVYKRIKSFGIDSTLYTLKWFFQCFIDKVPFTLTLRLWDSFIYYGEIILTGMGYTLLRLHKKKILKKNVEEFIKYLQVDLELDFGYKDDVVIETLFRSIEKLEARGLLKPKDEPSLEELPGRPFGALKDENKVANSEANNNNNSEANEDDDDNDDDDDADKTPPPEG